MKFITKKGNEKVIPIIMNVFKYTKKNKEKYR